MFGSAARGDMWPPGSPMHSDIDLIVVTRERVSDAEQEDLLIGPDAVVVWPT